jgi:hypothetical protein
LLDFVQPTYRLSGTTQIGYRPDQPSYELFRAAGSAAYCWDPGVTMECDAFSLPATEQLWSCGYTFKSRGHTRGELTISAEPALTGPSSITVQPNTASINGHHAEYLPAAPSRGNTAQLRLQFGAYVVAISGPYSKPNSAASPPGSPSATTLMTPAPVSR